MGSLGFSTIISEGTLAGGDDSIPTRAGVKLNAWLRKEAAAWPWPMLIKEVSGISLPANTTQLTLGAGSGGITDIIKEIRKPIRCYTSDFKRVSQLDIVDALETQRGLNAVIQGGQGRYGLPVAAKVFQSTTVRGQWLVQPFPAPDVAYLLTFPIHIIPGDYAGVSVPWYPEDDTMIELVKAFTAGWNDKALGMTLMQIVASKVVDDRLRHGGVAGFGEDLELDHSVFK